MGKKIKKVIKNNIFGFILGGLIFGTVGVAAATYCASSEVSYDNSSSGMKSTDVQAAIDELYQLASTSSSNGSVTIFNNELLIDENGNVRYYGSNPNNYVSFNNELWRVIGVIDGKIKLIRNEALTPVANNNGEIINNGVTIGTSSGFYWNKVRQSGKNYNNWEDSTLQTYLNGTYYNSLNSTYRNMISPSTYYLGGPTSSNYKTLTASGYYNAERDSSQVYSGGSYDPNPASTTQLIGLMYPSDYGYAAGESCLSTAIYNYSSSCKNNDYLIYGRNEWLQVPRSDERHGATILFSNGSVYYYYAYSGTYAVRPVLYLNSNVQITDGIGSQSNPFKLS